MLILRKRSKVFADITNAMNKPNVPREQEQQPNPENQIKTSQELTIEHMRLQRAMLQTQKQKQQVQAQEARDRMRQLQSAQKIEERKDEQESKNNIKRKKLEVEEEGAKNVNLYKSRSTPTAPVPMKH